MIFFQIYFWCDLPLLAVFIIFCSFLLSSGQFYPSSFQANPGIELMSKDHGSDCESSTFTTIPGSFHRHNDIDVHTCAFFFHLSDNSLNTLAETSQILCRTGSWKKDISKSNIFQQDETFWHMSTILWGLVMSKLYVLIHNEQFFSPFEYHQLIYCIRLLVLLCVTKCKQWKAGIVKVFSIWCNTGVNPIKAILI